LCLVDCCNRKNVTCAVDGIGHQCYVLQEKYIIDEQKNLKREYLRAQEEVKRIQSVPLVIGQFLEAIDATTGIVGYVRLTTMQGRSSISLIASATLDHFRAWPLDAEKL
jgi:ATP-dependent 26S proteasome regulatory subunit